MVRPAAQSFQQNTNEFGPLFATVRSCLV